MPRLARKTHLNDDFMPRCSSLLRFLLYRLLVLFNILFLSNPLPLRLYPSFLLLRLPVSGPP
jgi:hypothetical protein